MSDARKIIQGRQVSSSMASAQFRSGNNAAINGYAASTRTENAYGTSNFSSALRSEARAYERSGWEQEKRYQQEKKNMYFGSH